MFYKQQGYQKFTGACFVFDSSYFCVIQSKNCEIYLQLAFAFLKKTVECNFNATLASFTSNSLLSFFLFLGFLCFFPHWVSCGSIEKSLHCKGSPKERKGEKKSKRCLQGRLMKPLVVMSLVDPECKL